MEALMSRGLLLAAVMMSLGAGYPAPSGSYRTQNFIVQASSPQFAKQVGDEAERFRRELALRWLEHELPPWPAPCPIRVQDAPNLGAGGATEYTPTGRGVRDFRMSIQGSRERILDSVLPHEVTHTILASHFGQPLPRWADEGASTTVEHRVEKDRHEQMLREFLTHNRGIPMNQMFMMREYPSDILPLYAQGFSVSRFLIAQGGHRKFIDFVGATLRGNQWTHAVRENYGYESLAELQEYWLRWVADGSGNVEAYAKQSIDAGPVVQVAATEPVKPLADKVQPAPSAPANLDGALASAGTTGWYVRRRQEIAAKELPPVKRNFDKKPLRGHNIARPQPMQGVAPQGMPWGPGQGTVWR